MFVHSQLITTSKREELSISRSFEDEYPEDDELNWSVSVLRGFIKSELLKFTNDNPTLINDSIENTEEDGLWLEDINSEAFKIYSLVPPIAQSTMWEHEFPEDWFKSNSGQFETKSLINLESGDMYLG